MKKVLFSCLTAAICLSAYASETAKVTIELLSTNATYGTDVLELRENTDRNASYESGYDSKSMMSQSNKHSVLLYGFVGTTPCSYVATDNLDNLVIGITTNNYDTDYRLSFSNVSGRPLQLYDRVEKVTIDITEGKTYEFSVDASQVGRVAINNRFYINMQPKHYEVKYKGNESEILDTDDVTLIVPVAPEIEGFTFEGWDVVAGHLADGIILQAIYTNNDPTNAPEVVVNPANPSQKLVRDGQVYILRDNSTYTLQGQMVK